ncbi:MAG: rRNA maturation RNase YbeY [Nitrospinota bacterium]|nr:rRNA maturation RNase YbeY [Nitrospinota bacterium]
MPKHPTWGISQSFHSAAWAAHGVSMPVYLQNVQKKYRLKPRKLKKQAQTILEKLGCSSKELSILFTGDSRIRKLNARYRDIDQATDVLSFPQNETGETGSPLLGDVVISVETAWRQARDHNLSFDEELALLLIHGTLHLLGYDHETSPTEARRMKHETQNLFQIFFPERTVAGVDYF